MEKVLKVINEVITNPPIPHEPYKQSLKNWAMYCLRDRGFIVVYAQKGDFAVEVKGGEKLYFKVTTNAVDLDDNINWIVWDSATKKASLIPQML
ncbi:hypothetical protein [Anabaena lutea]|uniref:Uncharacterized protein n=1 Tax=Anabaena lutea FACHB-196 TaxID=2692881 RepID=A0ABR8FAR9_9NOST|nr:hypothetical protein [Anabaena lutea]MBD2567312.1 hypothetical protein [Anabaena lutea FACHB-196]